MTVVALTAVVGAAAEPARSPVTLRWQLSGAARDCIEPGDVERRVERRLAWDAIVADSDRDVSVMVTGDATRLITELSLADHGRALGSRQIEASSCAALVDAVVLALALAIDPTAPLDGPAASASAAFPDVLAPTASSAAPVVPVTTACPAVPTPTAPSCPAPPPPPPRLGARLRALYSVGLLPAPGAGLGLSVDRDVARGWSFAADLRWLPGVDSDDGRFAFGFVGGSLGPCGHLAGPLTLCGGPLVGALRGVVLSGVAGETGDQPWFGLELAPRVELRTRGLSVELGAAVDYALLRPRFTYLTGDFATSPLGLWLFAGVGPTIP